ncbi:NmrA family NAD(P)-binding protein [Mycobacterium branderi]|nr:NmrA family NAD(P)-binding protein [Mycobacterium branderi]
MANYWNSKEDVEAMVRDARFPVFTILKPAFMMENFIAPKVDWMFPHLRSGELLIGTNPDTVVALIAAADIGLATVAALGSPQRFNAAEIELAGDACTVADIASVIADAAGRRVSPSCVSAQEVHARLGEKSWSATQEWLGPV